MRLEVRDTERCVGCQSCMFACSRRHSTPGLAKSCIGVRSAGGMERGFVVVVCRACSYPPCAKSCPEGALVPREEGGVRFLRDACTGCGLCRQHCIIGAVFWDEETNRPMICSYCGYCAGYCPHSVLAFERKEGTEDAS